MGGIPWNPIEYAVAKILNHTHGWSYRQVGVEIHRSMFGVKCYLNMMGNAKPLNPTPGEWRFAETITDEIIKHPSPGCTGVFDRYMEARERLVDCRDHELACLCISREDDEAELRGYAVSGDYCPLVPDDMVDDQWKARSIKG